MSGHGASSELPPPGHFPESPHLETSPRPCHTQLYPETRSPRPSRTFQQPRLPPWLPPDKGVGGNFHLKKDENLACAEP